MNFNDNQLQHKKLSEYYCVPRSSPMSNIRSAALIFLIAIVSFLSHFNSAKAQFVIPTDFRNYAIISGGPVSFASSSTMFGDVYADGDITFGTSFGSSSTAFNGANFYTRGNFISTGFISSSA